MSYSPYAHAPATTGRLGLIKASTGISVAADGTLTTSSVPNGVVTTGSYSDPTWLTISKSKVGLSNVEDTKLSTWTGSSNITTIGTVTSGSAPANGGNSTTVAGLAVASARNNIANQIVRTQENGYIHCGYINSSDGNEGNNSNPPRVWGTNGSDHYMRTYLTSALSVNYATSAGSAPASDVYAWAKASTKPSYTNSEVGLGNVGNYTVSQNMGTTDDVTFNRVYANQFLYQSDAALKNNIENITGSWDILDKLRPVSFDWKNNQKSDYGFIAQELQEVLPNSVGSDGRSLGITPSAIIAHLVAAVKDLKSQVETLTKRLGD
jgi:hypothetical protein